VTVTQLTASDVVRFREMLGVMGRAFDEIDTYTKAQPSAAYLERLLGSRQFIAVVAIEGGKIIGGIGAYELQKFEQERSEIYIYDLAVEASHRRKGVATALVRKLQEIAAKRGAYVIFVQADLPDAAAIAFYSNLGTREDVLHFDIAVG
jgi:aminoglycoside 3-N-acetyltransferase I